VQTTKKRLRWSRFFVDEIYGKLNQAFLGDFFKYTRWRGFLTRANLGF